jgi:hypothetical protein
MLNPKQKQLISTYFPELAGSVNNTDALLSKVLQPIVDKMIVMKGEKGGVGNDGYTPIKGKDYWTDSEVNQVIAYILSLATPKKGVHYFDGQSIKGEKGVAGKDGRDGKNGRDGKDAVIVDTKELIKPFEKKLESGMALIQGRIKLIDQRWHGGGLSKVSHDGTLTGDGTPSNPLVAIGGTGGSGYQAPLTGGLTGTNTWTTAPNVIVVDGVSMQKTRTDGTVNWTIAGLTTTLTITPLYDIFASA